MPSSGGAGPRGGAGGCPQEFCFSVGRGWGTRAPVERNEDRRGANGLGVWALKGVDVALMRQEETLRYWG